MKIDQTIDRTIHIQKRLRQVPKIYQGIYKQAVEVKSRKSAIHAQCLECCGWEKEECNKISVKSVYFDIHNLRMAGQEPRRGDWPAIRSQNHAGRAILICQARDDKTILSSSVQSAIVRTVPHVPLSQYDNL